MNYVAARHRKRLLSDALGKGIGRGQVENTNLRVNGKDHDVTAQGFYGMSANTFWNRFFGDDAPNCLGQFYVSRGETLNFLTKWR